MDKPLRIEILEYLVQQDAIEKRIDIGTTFLIEDDSLEKRNNLAHALQYLKQHELISLSGSPFEMTSTMGGVLPSKYHSALRASITLKGEDYLKSKQIIEKPNATNTYHLNGAINPIIGDNNQSSIKADKLIANPTTINTTPKTNSTVKTVLIGLFIAVVGSVISAIIMVLWNR